MNRLVSNRLVAGTLAPVLVLAFASGNVAAQDLRAAYYVQPTSEYYPDNRDPQSDPHYDYARVIRVDPVFDSRGGYARTGQRCYQRQGYAGGYEDYDDRNGRYDDGYYRGDSYDPYGGGSDTGSAVATVIGGVIGAAIGSQVGGGSARYATSAIGTMVGGLAGREIYEQSRRQRDHAGTVTVCDPVPDDGRYVSTGNGGVTEYDVTYEYAGRQYTTRTHYHPGDRIRVRVDVRPE
ncbi:MAG: glycine zipper 2TM domain-containing protein [Lysobacter sp.]